jgi:hypothetical protein
VTEEQLQSRRRLFSAAMLAGDFATAEQLAIEIEPYETSDDDDRSPAKIPTWGTDA